jgi:hypothetical protein
VIVANQGASPRAIQDFLDAFNTIDAKLRKMTRTDRHVPFTFRLKTPGQIPIFEVSFVGTHEAATLS